MFLCLLYAYVCCLLLPVLQSDILYISLAVCHLHLNFIHFLQQACINLQGLMCQSCTYLSQTL